MIRSLNHRGGNNPASAQRFSVLLAALLLTVLQVVAVNHLIGHATTGDTSNCELCLNAVHGGNALVTSATPAPAYHALAGRLTVIPELGFSSRTLTAHRARGPPSAA